MRKISFLLSLCLLLCLAGCGKTPVPAAFDFSITWGVYGVSSYDSETGTLVKTSHATRPEDYVTTYFLTDSERETVRAALEKLDIFDYPDTYNPNGHLLTNPTETLVLALNFGETHKKVSCVEIGISSAKESRPGKGKRFRRACETIVGILTASDAWKALPEYEFLYD